MSAEMSPYCSAHDEWLIMKHSLVQFAYVGWSDTLSIIPLEIDNGC